MRSCVDHSKGFTRRIKHQNFCESPFIRIAARESGRYQGFHSRVLPHSKSQTKLHRILRTADRELESLLHVCGGLSPCNYIIKILLILPTSITFENASVQAQRLWDGFYFGCIRCLQVPSRHASEFGWIST